MWRGWQAAMFALLPASSSSIMPTNNELSLTPDMFRDFGAKALPPFSQLPVQLQTLPGASRAYNACYHSQFRIVCPPGIEQPNLSHQISRLPVCARLLGWMLLLAPSLKSCLYIIKEIEGCLSPEHTEINLQDEELNKFEERAVFFYNFFVRVC